MCTVLLLGSPWGSARLGDDRHAGDARLGGDDDNGTALLHRDGIRSEAAAGHAAAAADAGADEGDDADEKHKPE